MADDRPSRLGFPGSYPGDPKDVPLWSHRELSKLTRVVNDHAERLGGEFSQSPQRVYVGMVVWAKSPWDPGAGTDAPYIYSPSGWVKLT
jgi:hypothetical protein